MRVAVVDQFVAAPLEAVWPLAYDPCNWPSYSPFQAVALEQSGEDDPHGVGSVHRARLGRFTDRYRIESVSPPTSMAYTLVSGPPVRDYRAETVL